MSYTIYWTEQVRGWDCEQELRVRTDLGAIIGRPDFIPTEFDRLYSVPEVDGSRHSGNSLRALLKVLDAFEQASPIAKEETHGE